MAEKPKLPEPATCEDLTVVAYLVAGGRVFRDVVVKSSETAERDIANRRDGSISMPLVRLSDAQLLAAEVERLRADAERYQAIRNAGSLLKIYRYDDPADCCSGDWRYKPGAEEVDAWADELLTASRLAQKEAK